MAEKSLEEDFTDGIESNYDDKQDVLVPPPSEYENPMRSSSDQSSKNGEDRRDSSSLFSRMMNFGKDGKSGMSKSNPLAENNSRNRRSRHNSSELLAPNQTETPSNDSRAPPDEEGQLDGTIVVKKSRDGESLFEALKNLRTRPNYPRVEDIQTFTFLEEEYFSESLSPRAVDRNGLAYFAKLNKCWGLISRADMVSQPEKSPKEFIFRELDSNLSGFTDLYENELDLRRRPHSRYSTPRRLDPTDFRIGETLNSLAHREILVAHFERFIKQHDENCNQLQNLVHGLFSPSLSYFPSPLSSQVKLLHSIRRRIQKS
jgi:hypothetical protein